MVCIIDDREDIWDCAPNLVTVKPYRFFTGTGDINAPPGSNQAFTHAPAIPLHENAVEAEVDGKVGDPSERKEVDGGDNETPGTKDSSENGEAPSSKDSSETNKEIHEINHNEKLASSEKTNEEKGLNGETITEKEEGVELEVSEMQENNNQDNISSKVKNEEANFLNKEEVADGNHIEDHDDYLLYLEEILRRIHGSFYEVVAWNKQAEEKANESAPRVAPDLRYIVPELRRNVLNGTNVVFTGVIPRNCRHEDSQAWKIANQFGASVSHDILTLKNTSDRNKRTTHVIAARAGTEKACQAVRLPNVQLVNPNWLWTCAERWDWVDERLFLLEDYHEFKARVNDTPTSSTRGTPKRQENKGNLSEECVENITEDNLRIVLNPFLSFSSGEMEAMDKEVEELMKSSDEEDGDDKDEQILGSVSSSSNSTENGAGDDSLNAKMDQSLEEDGANGNIDSSKGKTVDFSTIKQSQTRHDEDGSPSKRRKLDFYGDDKSGGDDDGLEFSSDGGSSGSNSGDDEGNDMAAMLEAALYPS